MSNVHSSTIRDRSLKILHLNDVSNVATNLVEGLRELGVESEIFTITKGLQKSKILMPILIPFVKTLESLKLRDYIKRNKFNILHVHFASHAYMPLITGLPYFLHLHGTDARRYLYTPGLRELTRLAIKRAIKVFYVTPEMKAHIKNIRSDAIFLPNPINIEMFKPDLIGNHAKKDVLCISKLDRYKGLEDLLDTLEFVWQAKPLTRVSMFGFGNSSSIAKSFIQRHNSDTRLNLLQRISYDHMPHLIRSSSIILGHQCFEYGSLSCSELEAMACGKAVVVRFSYPEAYPTPPPVFISKSPQEACSHIIQLLDDPSLRITSGNQAREWIVKHHERNEISKTLLETYKNTFD
jgi:glycosyltransferase involved in cell wall biosynthesis